MAKLSKDVAILRTPIFENCFGEDIISFSGELDSYPIESIISLPTDAIIASPSSAPKPLIMSFEPCTKTLSMKLEDKIPKVSFDHIGSNVFNLHTLLDLQSIIKHTMLAIIDILLPQ